MALVPISGWNSQNKEDYSETDMQDTGKMECDMDMEYSSIQMAASMRDFGKII